MLMVKEAKKLVKDGVLNIFGKTYSLDMLGELNKGYDFENGYIYDEEGKALLITDHLFVGGKDVVLTFKNIDDKMMLVEVEDGVFSVHLGDGKEVKLNLSGNHVDVELKSLGYDYTKFELSDFKNYLEMLKNTIYLKKKVITS